MTTPFQQWLDEKLLEAESVRAFARAIGVDDSTVFMWRDRALLPNPGHEGKLVAANLIKVDALQKLVADSRRVRWEQREQAKAERAARKPLAKAPAASPYNSHLSRPPKRAARGLAFASA